MALLVALTSSNVLCAQPRVWEYIDSSRASLYLAGFDCADESNCVHIGRTGDPVDIVRQTTDAGRTWSDIYRRQTDPNVNLTFRAIEQPTPNVILAVGDSGLVLRSSDGGVSWDSERLGVSRANIQFLDMADERVAVASGARMFGVIRTEDAGANWTYLPFPDTMRIVSDVSLPDPQTVFVLAYDRVPVTASVYVSTDGGRTFEARGVVSQKGIEPLGVYFLDQDTGWVLGRRRIGQYLEQSSDRIEKTTDGGRTWRVMLDDTTQMWGGVWTADFLDARHGVAGGYGGKLWLTSDGGETWRRELPDIWEGDFSTVMNVSYVSAETAFAAMVMRGRVLKRTFSASVVERPQQPTPAALLTTSDGRLRIAVSDTRLESVRLIDSRGQQGAYWAADSEQEATTIDLSAIASGVYIVEITTNNGVERRKIVVQQ